MHKKFLLFIVLFLPSNLFCWTSMYYRGELNSWGGTAMMNGVGAEASDSGQWWHLGIKPSVADATSEYKFDSDNNWNSNEYGDADTTVANSGIATGPSGSETNLESNISTANSPWIFCFDTYGTGDKNYAMVEITAVGLCGQGFNSPTITWTATDAVNDMIQDPNNKEIWYKTVKLTGGTEIQFKFVPNDNWNDPIGNNWSYGSQTFSLQTGASGTSFGRGDSANLSYTPSTAGIYQFKFNLITGAYSIYRADVVLNELMWMGASSTADEWMELKNLSGNTVYLGGWTVRQTDGTGAFGSNDITISAGLTIPASGYFLISNYAAASSTINVTPDMETTGVELVNDDMEVRLYGGNFSYAPLIDNAGNGNAVIGDNDLPPAGSNATPKSSMERIPNPTPGNGHLSSEWATATEAVNLDPVATAKATPKASNSALPPTINAYHKPDEFEPAATEKMRTGKSTGYRQSSARSPVDSIYVCDTVTLHLAKTPAGESGLVTDFKVRESADSWPAGFVNMSYETTLGTTEYFKGQFSTSTVGGAVKGNIIQYYFKLTQPGKSTTYIYSGGTTITEATAQGNPFSYTIANAPPSEPSNPSPVYNQTEVLPNTIYSWTKSVDPDGENITGYRFEFSSTGFISYIVAETTGPPPRATISGLEEKTTYYWRVFAYSSDGSSSTWSNDVFDNSPMSPDDDWWLFNSYEPLTYLYRYGPEKPAYKRTIPIGGQSDDNWTYIPVGQSESTPYQKNDNDDNDPLYRIYNNHCVRLQSKTKRLSTSPTDGTACEIRFYYNIHGYEPNSNVDAGSDDPYFTGTYIAQDGGYDRFEVVIPEDIGTAGGWAHVSSGSLVGSNIGVKITGRDKNSTTWSKEQNTIWYFITREPIALKEGTTYFGERPDDVLWRPLKHIPKLIAKTTASALIEDKDGATAGYQKSDYGYFTPGERTPQTDSYKIDSDGFTVKETDNQPDCVFSENPNIFLRIGYGDCEIGTGKTSIVYSTNSTTSWTKEYKLERVSGVLYDLNNGFDYAGSNYWGGGRGNNDPATDAFWSHYSFLRTADNSIFTEGLPEGSTVYYYFNPVDGSDINQYLFSAASPLQVTDNEGTAQNNRFSYNILQDDRSRPYIKHTTGDSSSLKPQNPTVTELSFLSPATVTADIYDDKDGSDAKPDEKDDFSNTLYVGNNSGLFSGSGSAIGSADSLVHDTRVYYRITDELINGAITNADRYVDNTVYIPNNAALGQATEYDLNDANGDGKGYVQMNIAGGSGGNCSAQIPLKPSNAGKYLYYRIFVCNNDSDPQYKCNPSKNYVTDVNENDSTATKYNNHGTVGSVWADPYSQQARDSDNDHGWAMYTRYAGQITGPKMIRVTATAQIGKTPKSIITYINAEGGKVGNIIATEIKKGTE